MGIKKIISLVVILFLRATVQAQDFESIKELVKGKFYAQADSLLGELINNTSSDKYHLLTKYHSELAEIKRLSLDTESLNYHLDLALEYALKSNDLSKAQESYRKLGLFEIKIKKDPEAAWEYIQLHGEPNYDKPKDVIQFNTLCAKYYEIINDFSQAFSIYTESVQIAHNAGLGGLEKKIANTLLSLREDEIKYLENKVKEQWIIKTIIIAVIVSSILIYLFVWFNFSRKRKKVYEKYIT